MKIGCVISTRCWEVKSIIPKIVIEIVIKDTQNALSQHKAKDPKWLSFQGNKSLDKQRAQHSGIKFAHVFLILLPPLSPLMALPLHASVKLFLADREQPLKSILELARRYLDFFFEARFVGIFTHHSPSFPVSSFHVSLRGYVEEEPKRVVEERLVHFGPVPGLIRFTVG